MPELTAEQEQKYFEGRGAVSPQEIVEKAPETPETPEQPETPESDDKPDNRGKFVRHEALHEEREERKRLQQELRTRDADHAKLQERLDLLQQTWQQYAQQQQQTAAPKAPEFEKDPAEHLRQRAETLDQRVARMEQWERSQAEQAQRAAGVNQFLSTYAQQASAFTEKTQDFPQAYDHLLKSRAGELKAVGYQAAEITRIIHNEEAMIVGKAMQDGANPAERLYALAKHRGYKPAAEQKQEAGKEAADKLKGIAKGQQQAKSLSNLPGEAKQQLSLKTVAEMSEEDFKAVALDPKKWKALFQ